MTDRVGVKTMQNLPNLQHEPALLASLPHDGPASLFFHTCLDGWISLSYGTEVMRPFTSVCRPLRAG